MSPEPSMEQLIDAKPPLLMHHDSADSDSGVASVESSPVIDGPPVPLLRGTPADENEERPSLSYKDLIIESIESSPEKRLKLSEIYQVIRYLHPYYRKRPDQWGWQNSIRHNLSLHDCFVKLPLKQTSASGVVGHFWTVVRDRDDKVSSNRRRNRNTTRVRSAVPGGHPKPRSKARQSSGSAATLASSPSTPLGHHDMGARPESDLSSQSEPQLLYRPTPMHPSTPQAQHSPVQHAQQTPQQHIPSLSTLLDSVSSSSSAAASCIASPLAALDGSAATAAAAVVAELRRLQQLNLMLSQQGLLMQLLVYANQRRAAALPPAPTASASPLADLLSSLLGMPSMAAAAASPVATVDPLAAFASLNALQQQTQLSPTPASFATSIEPQTSTSTMTSPIATSSLLATLLTQQLSGQVLAANGTPTAAAVTDQSETEA